MNYVKFYKKAFNIDFDGKKYEIHHLDFDRTNNSISNLLLLPKSLHRRYHLVKGVFESYCLVTSIQSTLNGYSYVEDYMKALGRLADVLAECRVWADYKEYLLGNFPNVHHITLETRK